MKSQRSITSDDEHRVLQFRPRATSHPRHPSDPRGNGTVQPLPGKTLQNKTIQEPRDLSRYEQRRDQPDDFRQRMLANIAALAFTIALAAISIWLAVNIANRRQTQDCLTIGRRDCVRVAAPRL